ncbi:hypothetical protein PGTUg99_023961 [Puccinia graminis f. sp. tritici]|uniref:Uncharacterized protein n=1 Tax=Puccinia graminis f. sp. tritici TaxID=56615 RepID=A0A5B0NHY9_PUCGR|nr:hypothetical protein PGTUg99_023961 [Puccinia graminis f. sp. tritici]
MLILLTTLVGPIQVSAQCNQQYPQAWWFCSESAAFENGLPTAITDCSSRCI